MIPARALCMFSNSQSVSQVIDDHITQSDHITLKKRHRCSREPLGDPSARAFEVFLKVSQSVIPFEVFSKSQSVSFGDGGQSFIQSVSQSVSQSVEGVAG